MSETLAPCPFCGGNAELQWYAHPNVTRFYWVACTQCQADTPLQGIDTSNQEAVIEFWNRRAESADHAALTKRVADLEETLAFAAQYKGIEARACPLCHYENGVFVDRCQMHKDMDALTKQVAELEAALAAATRYVPVEDGEYEGVQILEDGTFISFRDRDELGQPCWSAYTLGDLVVCRVAGKGKNE